MTRSHRFTISSFGTPNERPDAVYVHSIDQHKGLTFGQLRAVSDGLGGYLAEAGIAANDRVLLLAENSVEFHAVFVGVLRYGATIVTVNVDMNQAHLAEILAAVRPKLVIVPGRHRRGRSRPLRRPDAASSSAPGSRTAATACSARSHRDGTERTYGRSRSPDDHGVIFYTSGTVAKPKGVIQTHATAFLNYDATADYLGLAPGVRVFDCRSFAWLSAQHMALGRAAGCRCHRLHRAEDFPAAAISTGSSATTSISASWCRRWSTCCCPGRRA